MFSEIYTSKQPAPLQSYSLILCSVAVTVATLVFPNLQHVFGSFDEGTDWVQRLTIAFQHGFEWRSSVVHLIVDVVLLAFIGIFAEKVLGSGLFFVLTVSTLLWYLIVHSVFGMMGHGGSGLTWAYAPVVFYVLNEGRLLKTRSQFDEFFRTLRMILLLMYLVVPVLMSIIPIYFDSETPIMRSVFYGNLFHITSTLWGVGFVMLFREDIRIRLKQFAKKKKFEPLSSDSYSAIFPWFYPLLLAAGFFLSR
jgi:hypothetical protein